MSDKQHTASRPSGTTIITDPDAGMVIEADTLQCVHCATHWEVKPGSGKLRGFCTRCNGPVCGPRCAKCVPIERQLENMESGRAADAMQTSVSVPVPKLWLPGNG